MLRIRQWLREIRLALLSDRSRKFQAVLKKLFGTFKQAQKVQQYDAQQPELGLG